MVPTTARRYAACQNSACEGDLAPVVDRVGQRSAAEGGQSTAVSALVSRKRIVQSSAAVVTLAAAVRASVLSAPTRKAAELDNLTRLIGVTFSSLDYRLYAAVRRQERRAAACPRMVLDPCCTGCR